MVLTVRSKCEKGDKRQPNIFRDEIGPLLILVVALLCITEINVALFTHHEIGAKRGEVAHVEHVVDVLF